MTTAMHLPPLPAAAVDATEFDDNTWVVFGPNHYAGNIGVRASAIQHRAGIITMDEERPAVQLGSGNQALTPQQARQLALGLLNAAELAEQWAVGASRG